MSTLLYITYLRVCPCQRYHTVGLPTRVSHTGLPTRVSHTAPTRVSHTTPTRVSHTTPTRVSHTAPTRVSHTLPTRVSADVPPVQLLPLAEDVRVDEDLVHDVLSGRPGHPDQVEEGHAQHLAPLQRHPAGVEGRVPQVGEGVLQGGGQSISTLLLRNNK